MNEREKFLKDITLKENFELNLLEFYKELKKAIMCNNIQTIYKLSKIFNRNFKNLDN